MLFVHRLYVVLHAVDRFRQGMQSRAVSNPFVQVASSGMLLELLLLCRFCTSFETVGGLVRVAPARVDSVALGLQVIVLVACLVVAPVRPVPPLVVLARLSVLRLCQRRLLLLSTFVVRFR
jgi:hypothetical protein